METLETFGADYAGRVENAIRKLQQGKGILLVDDEDREGVTTGVSAADRLQTIRTAVADGACPGDLCHPGHVFPLQARENGVFDRRGHTEGSVDLVRLAGLGDAAILCELTNADGTMARLPEILCFAREHDMSVVSVEDICRYRKSKGENNAKCK